MPEERGDRVFTDYHRAHRHAAGAQDADSPAFQIPAAGGRYPRGSLPALEAATWVREVHPGLFAPFDLALFEAFFGRTEDISDPKVLEKIAGAVGLEPLALRAALSTGRYRSIVLQEYLEATNRGIHGIPTVLIPDQAPLVGAALYTDLKCAVQSAFASRLAKLRVDPASGNVLIQEGSAQF